MATYLGMRGTGDWSTDERPKNFREGILFDNPNGIAPLTAILSKMSNTKVDDPEYSWWTQEYPTQSETLADPADQSTEYVFSDAILETEVVAGTSGAAADVYVCFDTEAERNTFKVGHEVVLRDDSRPDRDVVARVTAVDAVVQNSVYPVSLKLLQAEHVADTLGLANTMQVVGNANSEGSTRPSAQAIDPTKHYNYTQIFRTAHEVTRTASKTRLRTKEALAGTRRDSLEFHMMEIEKAFMFGVRSETVPSGEKTLRTTDGIISAIRRNTPANVSDFATNGGGTWAAKGKTFLEDELEKIFRYGDKQKIALCGSGALLGLNRLAGTDADINITPGERAYGIRIQEWITPFGTVDLLTHPLMSDVASTRNSMLILEPKRLKYRFIDDTTFIQDNLKNRGGNNSIDAYQEEYLTECGLEYSHTRAMGYLTQIGVG